MVSDVQPKQTHTGAVRAGAGVHLGRYVPIIDWLGRYRREDLIGDVMAGVVVAIMLVPQSMAYAMLAGLPPQAGLYASVLPLILYAVFGTSRTLAVGPVAIVSLMTATSVGALAPQGTAEYVALALLLALLVGVVQVVMGVARVGFLVNFLSTPVLSGFTSAAALVIGASQLATLLGLSIPGDSLHRTLLNLVRHLSDANPVTTAIGLGSILLLVFVRRALGRPLARWGVPPAAIGAVTKAGPLIVVVMGTLIVWGLRLHATASVQVVGSIPAGLPPLTVPRLDPDAVRALLPTAIAISFVSFMESVSVAKALASKRRQRIEANQELIGLGAANLGAALTGGYPVTGGFSRSVVNFTAGANTQLASIITAGLVALTVLFLTPLFQYLPRTVLAAIVIVAVASLIDVATLTRVWRYDKADAVSLLVTFMAVLVRGVEFGILAGMATAIFLYLWRTSRPHIAVVGRVGESETYRNVLRHETRTCPRVVAVRVDESLYFPNTRALEETLLRLVAERPETTDLVLIGSGINFIDASALAVLESLHVELRGAGVTLHLAEFKGPVMDRLRAAGFIDRIGRDRVFLSTHQAMQALGCA